MAIVVCILHCTWHFYLRENTLAVRVFRICLYTFAENALMRGEVPLDRVLDIALGLLGARTYHNRNELVVDDLPALLYLLQLYSLI